MLTSQNKTYLIDGVKHIAEYINVSPSDLYFNPTNSRIELQMRGKKEKENFTEKDSQNFIREKILSTLQKGNYEKLRKNIEDDGIQQPLLIDKNNRIISGNTRIAIIINEFHKKNKSMYEVTSNIPAYIIRENLTEKQIKSLEQKTQEKFSFQIKYDSLNRAVSFLNRLNDGDSLELISNDNILKQNIVKKEIKTAELYFEFLSWNGIKDASFYQQRNLYTPLNILAELSLQGKGNDYKTFFKKYVFDFSLIYEFDTLKLRDAFREADKLDNRGNSYGMDKLTSIYNSYNDKIVTSRKELKENNYIFTENLKQSAKREQDVINSSLDEVKRKSKDNLKKLNEDGGLLLRDVEKIEDAIRNLENTLMKRTKFIDSTIRNDIKIKMETLDEKIKVIIRGIQND